MTKTVFAVAHSHWDHEWYFTQEDADIVLVENLDYLIKALESDPEFTCYTFDGQASIVEKYLRIRPENKKRIKKLISEHRLFVGPWYTQTDALLGKTESVVRNLLYGVKMTKSLGHTMNIGYAPDIFGMHAYFPSIYKRFGLQYSIFQRGVYNEQVNKNLNFNWKAPNNETIPANNIFYGYGPGKFLNDNGGYIKNRLKPILDNIAEHNQSTDNLLLPSGGDQVLINRKFPEIINKLNKKLPDYHIKLTSYEDFMQQTWNQKDNFPNTIEGELVAGQKSRIHNTCRSERYDIKYLNFEVEDLLLNELEPLCSIATNFGIKFPQNWLDQIWIKVFESGAHNGIGASNSDDANHDIVVRLTSAHRQIKDLINLIKRQIVGAITKSNNKSNLVVLFNTNIKNGFYRDRITLFTKSKNFSLKNSDGNYIHYTIDTQNEIDGGKKIIVTAKGEKEEKVPNYFKTKLWVDDVDVPSMGFETLEICERQCEDFVDNLVEIDSDYIENKNYKLSLDNSNHLHLLNKISNKLIDDPFCFDESADYGDSFDYSPLKGDVTNKIDNFKLLRIKKSHLCQIMEIESTVQLPISLSEYATKRSEQRSKFIINTKLVLDKGNNTLRVEHRIDNHIKDHRVRVLWKTGVMDMSKNYADQGYSMIERKSVNPYESIWKNNNFVEKPKAIFVFESMIVLTDKSSHFSIHIGMLKEYQPYPEEHILALTLFRSNGLLGRDNLAWRPGRASGINNMVVKTPDGQMQQAMSFEYNVEFGEGSIDPQESFTESDSIYTKFDFYQQQNLNSYLNRIDRFQMPSLDTYIPETYSFLDVKNKNIFFSALKKAWSDNGFILRLFNPTDIEQPLDIKINQNIYDIKIVDLKEDFVGKFSNGQSLAAHDYVTLKFNN